MEKKNPMLAYVDYVDDLWDAQLDAEKKRQDDYGDKHNSEIWINIRHMENGRMAGDETEDKDNLILCGCPIYFEESEFPSILKRVSFYGFGLRTGNKMAGSNAKDKP